MPKVLTKTYIVYDERAMYDVDQAHIFSVEETLLDAKKFIKEMGINAVVYEYTVKGNILTDEVPVHWKGKREGQKLSTLQNPK